MNSPVQSEYRSHRIRVYLLRLWWPALLIFVATQLVSGAYRAIVVALPMYVIAVFYVFAAEVRVSEDALWYRRWRRWIRVPYNEIYQCTVSVAPGLGVLRLSRPVSPWSRLYFVREEPTQVLLPGGQSSLTSLINTRRSGNTSVVQEHRSGANNGRAVCGIAMITGIVAALLSRLLLPDVSIQFGQDSFPRWVVAYENFQRAASEWPWNLLMCCLLVVLLVVLRFRRKAWGAAFALGGILGLTAARVIG